ncbi:MAG: hypothetical protein CMJ46_10965 [Planctomyces sp.]|nr:hypothetical protein [Planctomyces sp.]
MLKYCDHHSFDLSADRPRVSLRRSRLSITLLAIVTAILCGGSATVSAQQTEADPRTEFDPAILEPIQDKTLGIRPEESAAYYQLLYTIAHEDAQVAIDRARQFWEERKAAHPEFANAEHPHFADLFKNPAEYRGEVITQTGYVRRIVSYAAGDNDFGIEKLYEAWVYPETGQSNPIVVVFTVPPSGAMQEGEDLNYHVGLTGYFFKLYGYQAQDTTRLAPLILAGAIEPLPTRIDPDFIQKRILFFLATFVVVLCIMGYILYTGLKKKDRTVAKATLPKELPEFEDTSEKPDDSAK